MGGLRDEQAVDPAGRGPRHRDRPGAASGVPHSQLRDLADVGRRPRSCVRGVELRPPSQRER